MQPGTHARCVLLLLRDTIFPPACVSCGGVLAGGCCCKACLSALCPVSSDDPQFLEVWGRLRSEGDVSGLVVGWYLEREGVLRTLIHALKYQGRESIGEDLGRSLGVEVQREWSGEIDALLPVPLHRRKERERGYNQCGAIARGIGAVTGIPVEGGLLRRSRWTPSQTALGVKERRTNVRGAFMISPGRREDVAGRRLLLVDDILTTGATLLSCAETLVAGGAASVRCCALGLSQGPIS
jgi:ComF family protein